MKNTTFPLAVHSVMTVTDLAAIVKRPARLLGDPETRITHLASPKDARVGTIVFCRATDALALAGIIQETQASVVISAWPCEPGPGRCHVVTDDPLSWFIEAADLLIPSAAELQVHPEAILASDVVLGAGVSIGSGTVIEAGCRIADGVSIGSNCFIGAGTHIGRRTAIQNQVSIGGAGLGYHHSAQGERLFFPHLGHVIVGADVVIGTGCVLVRGQLDDTLIADACRLGNLVNIGHNVQLGQGCVISSSSCVAGGARVGAGCQMGIGVMINAKIELGAKSWVGMGSVVTKDFPAQSKLFGNPARHIPTMEAF